MLVLWIVIGVVVLAGLSVSAVAGTRRRRPRSEVGRGPAPGGPSAPTRPPVAQSPPTPTFGPPAETAPVEDLAYGEQVLEELEAQLEEEVEGEIAEAEAAAVAAAAEVPAPPRFRDRLGKARGLLGGYLGTMRSRSKIDEETWDELEEALLRADVGVATATSLIDDLRGRVAAKAIDGPDGLVAALKEDLLSALTLLPGAGTRADGDGDGDGDGPLPADRNLRFDGEPDATDVWLFVGVNGVGKTTTVGKVARREHLGGRSVLLAAGDTFRAAAGEQLAQWAERSGAEIVRGAEGGDPSAIVFDAVQRASARGNDLVLADTAGRLHTKVNLVEELKKIRRVADRSPGRVTEVLLVLDATTGQNALAQAKQFTDAVGVTGLVLTKLDGTAKGGVVVAVQRELGLPVKLVGLGEGPDDLVPFDPQEFVDALIG